MKKIIAVVCGLLLSIQTFFSVEAQMNKEKIKIILMHGNGTSSIQDNWFPYLKRELEKLGLTVIARQFPDTDLARSRYWLPFLQDELKADEYSILVGHSSGAIAAMRFAQSHKILGSILVGTYHTDINDEKEKASGYFDEPWQWDAIKNNQKWIVQFASSDDPWISIEEARFVHENLNTEYYEFIDQGHFGCDYYKETFPEIVEIIKEKLQL